MVSDCCTVHFMRNVCSKAPSSKTGAVAAMLKTAPESLAVFALPEPVGKRDACGNLNEQVGRRTRKYARFPPTKSRS